MITLTLLVLVVVLVALIGAILEFLWPVVLIAISLLLLDIVVIKTLFRKKRKEKKDE